MDINSRIVQLRDENDLTFEEIAQLVFDEYAIRLSAEAVRSRYRRTKGSNKTVITSNNNEILVASDVKSLKALLDEAEVDQNKWQVDSFTVNKWGENWQVKASLRRKTEKLTADILERILKKSIEVPKFVEFPDPLKDGGLLELSIFDLHFGKRADGYNVEVAKRLFNNSARYLLSRSKSHRISRIVFPIGNDLFHIDNPSNTTTAGTSMENVDGSYYDHVEQVIIMLRGVIEYAAGIAPVDIVMVAGNHDMITTFHLGVTLSVLYSDTDRVHVQYSNDPRQYYRYENILLGFTHGNKPRLDNLPLLMAAEAKRDWGECDVCEFHHGHWHGKSAFEKNGVRVRGIPSLCASDDWHIHSGFVKNVRDAEAFLWHPQYGMIDNYHAPVDLINSL
jgi:hypothetical protein